MPAAQGQRIERVTVYPSDYGLAQMAEEAKLGPRAIFAPKPAPPAGDEELPEPDSEADSDSNDDASGDDEGGAGPRAGRDASADDGAEVDQARLRMYERSKLRWHYAVVVCDGVPTAAHLYRECDGLEFEISATRCGLPHRRALSPPARLRARALHAVADGLSCRTTHSACP
jgi:hypothetical protein